jgi:hypothetical protein
MLALDFFYISPKAQATKAKINKLDYIKLRSFYKVNNQQYKKVANRQEINMQNTF